MKERTKEQILLKPITIPKRPDDQKKEKIQKFLLCCMDYRYPDAVIKFMEKKGWKQDYDIFVLAGACIGVMYPDEKNKQHWRQSFLDHLELGQKLHKFTEVVVIHHFDCGAYKQVLGKSPYDKIPREQQYSYHKEKIQETRDLVFSRFPAILSFQAYILQEVEPSKAQYQFYSAKKQPIISFEPQQIQLKTDIQYQGPEYAQQDTKTIIADLKNKRALLNKK